MGILKKLIAGAVNFGIDVVDKASDIILQKNESQTENHESNGIATSKSIGSVHPEASGVFCHAIDTKDNKTILDMKKYVVFDTETTGLSRYNDKIIEIGIITVNNGVIDRYETFINPEMHIPSSASKVNGIYDKDVVNAPTYSEIAPVIHEKLHGIPIIAHNASFDLAFIENMFCSEGLSAELFYLDTLSLSRRYMKNLPDHKLQTLIAYFGIEKGNAHRAGDDAFATMQVFEHIRSEMLSQIEMEKALRKKIKEQEAAERKARYGASPLFNVSFVFVGRFSMPFTMFQDKAIDVGAVRRNSVSGRTNYLVLGDTYNLPDWAAENLAKAKELNALGKGPKIISEKEYLAMVSDAEKHLSR